MREIGIFDALANPPLRLPPRGVAMCLLLGGVTTPLGAQDSVLVVPDPPACTTCSLNVTAIVELGDREGPGIVGEQAAISRADNGHYYVSSLMQEGRLQRPLLRTRRSRPTAPRV